MRVEVDHEHPEAMLCQPSRQVDRRRRLPDSALLVRDQHHPGARGARQWVAQTTALTDEQLMLARLCQRRIGVLATGTTELARNIAGGPVVHLLRSLGAGG